MAGFARIPAGWFLMGSTDGQADEGPVHPVWVDAFELAVDPVTRGEYAGFRQPAAPRRGSGTTRASRLRNCRWRA